MTSVRMVCFYGKIFIKLSLKFFLKINVSGRGPSSRNVTYENYIEDRVAVFNEGVFFDKKYRFLCRNKLFVTKKILTVYFLLNLIIQILLLCLNLCITRY